MILKNQVIVSIKVKKKFLFDRFKNEYYHKDYPSIRFDVDTFHDMNDFDIQNFIENKIKEINFELNSPKPQRNNNPPLSTNEVLTKLADLKRKINEESFKKFFMKKIRLNP
jgi:hypothetical protein